MGYERSDNLASVATDTRLLGGVLVVLGLILMYVAYDARPSGLTAQAAAGAIAVTLVGPGVWYVIAGGMIRRLQRRAVDVSLRVAAVQSVAIAVVIAIGWAGNSELLTLPALVACFFVPALGVLVWTLVRARRLVDHVAAGGHGFEPIPLARRSDQPIVNVRGK